MVLICKTSAQVFDPARFLILRGLSSQALIDLSISLTGASVEERTNGLTSKITSLGFFRLSLAGMVNLITDGAVGEGVLTRSLRGDASSLEERIISPFLLGSICLGGCFTPLEIRLLDEVTFRKAFLLRGVKPVMPCWDIFCRLVW